ncbi:hypothetical protein BC834DRAFT_869295 [Gloeopeniophorella convolvens]|nr:hypothetical protein BC834DRAFT_869295 [Gloeopeniophorella convolvens]
MNIPRFANPHLRERDIETVSRSDLFSRGASFAADNDAVVELNELLKSHLGDIDSPRPRKRRKHAHSVQEQPTTSVNTEVTPFRLVSATLPPYLISLEEKPLSETIAWEPPCEDTYGEADARRQQAHAAAVDLSALFESARAYTSRPHEIGKVIRASADTMPPSPPAFFLAEAPRKPDPQFQALRAPEKSRPSPHEVVQKIDSLHTIHIEVRDEHPASARSKRRKRKRRVIERSHATFWRPLSQWGGKSSGYAMGYEGSWPVEHEDELRQKRYVRDNMKKAIHAIP